MTNRLWVGGFHPGWQTLPRFFKDNGYDTLRAGKIFHAGIDGYDGWTQGGEKRKFEGPNGTRKERSRGSVRYRLAKPALGPQTWRMH